MKLPRVLDHARELSRSDFLERYPHPAFLIRPHTELHETTLLQTLKPDSLPEGDLKGHQVQAIVKREGAAGFPSLVTLGRSEGNDICFNAPGVSKYHAYVRIGPASPELVDAGSTFGTSHNGRKLQPRGTPVPLMSGDDVVLGESVGMLFLSADALYDYLQELLRDSDTPFSQRLRAKR